MTAFQISTRTRRHPLSKAQITVLEKLVAEGACPTSTKTSHVYVSGTATAALARRGFVKMTTVATRIGRIEHTSYQYEITDAGRRALEQAKAKS